MSMMFMVPSAVRSAAGLYRGLPMLESKVRAPMPKSTRSTVPCPTMSSCLVSIMEADHTPFFRLNVMSAERLYGLTATVSTNLVWLLDTCRFVMVYVFENNSVPVLLLVAVTETVPETFPEPIDALPEVVTVTPSNVRVSLTAADKGSAVNV